MASSSDLHRIPISLALAIPKSFICLIGDLMASCTCRINMPYDWLEQHKYRSIPREIM